MIQRLLNGKTRIKPNANEVIEESEFMIQSKGNKTDKSASCKGPIGWFMPKRRVLSMSSRAAVPFSKEMSKF